MICALHRPGEAAAVFQAWASWLILDWCVEFLVGKSRTSHVLTALVGLFLIALFNDSCAKIQNE